MRVIKLPPPPTIPGTNEPLRLGGEFWTMKEFIRTTVRLHVGFSKGIDGIRTGSRILDAVDSAPDSELPLDDKLYEALRDAVNTVDWSTVTTDRGVNLQIMHGPFKGRVFVAALMEAESKF